jgi:hypothetical protein
MAIDLTALLSGATPASSTVSPMAMYKKLQKLAEENAQVDDSETAKEKAAAITREFNNAAVRVRNAQYREQNAQVQNDATYYKNRAATATTAAELVNDDRFLKVLAYGNGFGDLYLNNRQRLRDILLSDLNDANSVARQGSLKEVELAKKYNFGTAGSQYDTDGNVVGVTAEGRLVNDGTGTPLAAGLAKLRGLTLDVNGKAMLTDTPSKPETDGKLIQTIGLAVGDVAGYTSSQTKALLQEQKAPEKSSVSTVYEFDSTEFQKFRERRDVQMEADYYKDNIDNIKTVDDLFDSKNHRLLKFVLYSYGLAGEEQYPGKIRKILESDLGDINSLANRFQDPRYQQMAKDLSLPAAGVVKLKLGTTTADMVTRYERLAYERHLDEQAPGVRAAIEFGRRIKDVSQTVQLLGDAVLREVVTVANNIPKELAYQEVDSQVTALEKRIDVKSLSGDKNEVEKLVMRYLTFKDGGYNSATSQSYLTGLFG